MIGQHIGNFVVTRSIGKGGMGEVFLAEHPTIGLQVAIKVLSRQLSDLEMARSRFLIEAKAAAQIHHPNVIEVFDFGTTEDGRPYQVMELLSGMLLTAVIKGGKLSPGEAHPFLEPICKGLQAAHDLNVVHRDLKPDNIHVQPGDPPEVKLLDFGLVKLTEGLDDATRTSTGMVLGTPLYISPEQAAGRASLICPQTDLYALGIILFQMLSGELPFEDESTTLLLAKHITDQPPSLRDVAPSVPLVICQLVDQCLRKEPAARPSSAAEVAARFRAALGHASDLTLPNGTGGPRSRHEEPLALAVTQMSCELSRPDGRTTSTLTSFSGEMTSGHRPPILRWSGSRAKLLGGTAALLLVIVAAVLVLRLYGGQPMAPLHSGVQDAAPPGADSTTPKSASPPVDGGAPDLSPDLTGANDQGVDTAALDQPQRRPGAREHRRKDVRDKVMDW